MFAQLAPGANQQWQYTDGDQVEADECLVTLTGCARGLLTAERIAMNFLQTLSGTATTTAAQEYVTMVTLESVESMTDVELALDAIISAAKSTSIGLGVGLGDDRVWVSRD